MFNISRGVMGDDSPRSPFVPTPFVYEPAQPQKWEYRVERIDRDERGPLDQERLTALGAEGWLLAGVVNWPGAQPATYYYFVRAA
ncbi:MAG TPA: hypothetical protein VHR15_10785 [Ktedonobacterales bacterium]|jgi:hypothetical protein|nr:hypothetical protein [Ktedonobacterales bacterium]